MRKIVIVTGSGISMSPPSNLPSWWQYNVELINVIKEKALILCPEAEKLLEIIDVEKTLPVQCISDIIVNQGAGNSYFPLLSMLNSSRPNMNHFALVKLAEKGVLKAIVSTNFDTLIETAFLQSSVPLFVACDESTYSEIPSVMSCKLLKVHGSVEDYDSLIDTVTQKAVGLSDSKRVALEGIFQDSEIVFMGFSGADLDFDIDYLPIRKSVLNGSNITWILHPNSQKHHSVDRLIEAYSGNMQVLTTETADYFQSLGVDIDSISAKLLGLKLEDTSDQIRKHIKKEINGVFSQPHIGTHGCVAYCITLLDMIGENVAASELAKVYESKLDSQNLDIFSCIGLNTLGLQKMREGDMKSAKFWFFAEEKCLQKMFEINNQIIDQELKGKPIPAETIKQENHSNLATCYSNLGLISLHEEEVSDAICFFNLARLHAEACFDKRTLSIIMFNLANANYKKNKNIDQYLDSLRTCAELSKTSGNLHTLVEILQKDCKIRMNLGEYYIAQSLLHEIESHLNNIGNFSLHIIYMILKAEFYLRKGENELLVHQIENVIKILEVKHSTKLANHLLMQVLLMPNNLDQMEGLIERLCNLCEVESTKLFKQLEQLRGKPDNKDLPLLIEKYLPDSDIRKCIVYLEYHRRRNELAVLFQNLCILYTKQCKYLRLFDVASCYCDVANNESDRSVALYYMGVAKAETSEYLNASELFEKVVQLNDPDITYLGWSYIELGKLYIEQNKTDLAEKNYQSAMIAFFKKEDPDELVKACMGYINKAIEAGKWDIAFAHCNDLLERIQVPEQRDYIQRMLIKIEEERISEKEYDEIDVKKLTPEKIATIANKLFFYNNTFDKAWKLINIAKDKYEEKGDYLGVSKCENNMGNFCIKEGKTKEAIAHFTKSFEIRKKIGDISGAISQICNIVNFLIQEDDDPKKYVQLLEMYLPEVATSKEKYTVYYSLFLYYAKYDYGKALKYAQQSLRGIRFIHHPGDTTSIEEILTSYISTVEKYYKSSLVPPQGKFDDQLSEAKKLYETGNIDKSISLLNKLKDCAKGDSKKLGQIAGSIGEALRINHNYDEAIRSYDEAIELFSSLQDEKDEIITRYLIAAINGKAISLYDVGKKKESISILREILSKKEKETKLIFPIVVTLCNRLILEDEDVEKSQDLNIELTALLSKYDDDSILNHEEHGTLYHLRGLLAYLVSDYTTAADYFRKAITEFIICNSPRKDVSKEMLKVTLGKLPQ